MELQTCYVYAGTRETYLHDKGNELELKQDETATAEVRTQEKIVHLSYVLSQFPTF